MNQLCPGNARAALALCVGLPLFVWGALADESPVPLYNRDIRPILSDNCFRCHGPELKSRKARLRLDVREAAVERKAIVPGIPDESEMIRRLETDDPDDLMPPKDTHKVVTPGQIETLRRWITAGAKYEAHWSYAPVQRPAVPPVRDAQWARTPLDKFVLARLEEKSIAPAPAAARRTLLRRLALDLTGLPPTPEAAERFVKDRSRDAYGEQVERLLASPHYGERMAVPWLDAARFADTVGYHGDQNQNVFPYRDYVIESFNRNKPFDQFTIEQLAGDLLPGATVEQKTATGFNRLNMMTREGGAQPAEYLAKYQADRVRTVSTAWLGSTMACAECHDHKYDPFTAKDFYALSAFFADVRQWGVYADYGYTANPELRDFKNEHPFPPELFVTNTAVLRREARLRSELNQFVSTTARGLDASARQSFQDWKNSMRASLKDFPDGWWAARSPEARLAGTNAKNRLVVQPHGVIVAHTSGKNDKYEITLEPPAGWLAAIKLELLPAGTNQTWSRKADAGAQITFQAQLLQSTNKPVKLAFRHSAATVRRLEYKNGTELLSVHPTWRLDAGDTTNSQCAIYLLDPPIMLGGPGKLKLTVASGNLSSFRVATTPIAAANPLAAGVDDSLRRAILGNDRKSRSDALVWAWIRSTTNQPVAYARTKELESQIRECRHGVVPTLVTESWTNHLVTRVLPRGNWQDTSGEIVSPAVPHFLPQPRQDGTNQLNRLDLARWLVARENPLTARAFVNRLWKQFFGNGLSNQPEELGAQGEYPTHPELLDWLAVEFRESGWDVKHIVRLIVTSAAYQQAATFRPELLDLDPNNRLLARQNARRLDAEFVRDNALAIAGLLNLEIGGPSAFPYQPAGYYANLQFPNRDYFASPDEQQHRRGLYSHWQRTFLHPMLANFDAPAREECAVDRPQSSTPQQALTLLNDPSFVEAARVFAEKILAAPKRKTDAARVEFAVEAALLRPAKPAERESLLKFLDTQRTYYTAHADEAEKLLHAGRHRPASQASPAEQAAWTSLARVILNLHESITRY